MERGGIKPHGKLIFFLVFVASQKAELFCVLKTLFNKNFSYSTFYYISDESSKPLNKITETKYCNKSNAVSQNER